MAYGDNMGNPGEAGGSVGDWGGGEGEDGAINATIANIMRSINAQKARVGQPRQGTEMDSFIYGMQNMGPTAQQQAITNILNQNMTPGYSGGEVGYGGYSNFGSDR